MSDTPKDILNIRLPKGYDQSMIREILSVMCAELGFVSKHGPRSDKGSLGQMLVAIATGRAMVINLETTTPENESPLEK